MFINAHYKLTKKPHIMKKVILLAFLAFGMQQAQAQYKFLQYRNVSEKNMHFRVGR
jgi:hypothetical protein